MSLIELKNISKTYHTGKIAYQALNSINLSIDAGEFVAIIGPSGSGKSTLMNILGCLDIPTKGDFFLSGKNVSHMNNKELAHIRNQQVGFVFQRFHLLPYLSALENLLVPLIYAGNKPQKVILENQLADLGLLPWKTHKPNELSGGQQQRVAIARALIHKPSLILADEPTGNLDSATGQEVINLLNQENQKGTTIILVTHDEKVASYAHRVIEIQDGQIAQDIQKTKGQNKAFTPKQALHKKSFFLKLADYFSIAFKSIVHKKLRTFLTTLGILVGIASVISMVALGEGTQKKIKDNIMKMGSNLVYVFNQVNRGGNRNAATSSRNRLTIENGVAIEREAKSVEAVSPIVHYSTIASYGNKNLETMVSGTNSKFLEVNNFSIKYGSFFDEAAVRSNAGVAVLGHTLVKDLYDGKNPVGSYIKINRMNFLVIGCLEEKGAESWRDQDNTVLIPVTTVQKTLAGQNFVSLLSVQVKDQDLMDMAVDEMTEILRKDRRISPNQQSDFRIQSQTELITQAEESTKTFRTLLVGIAAISLLVGGIGIMNIMLVSVMERIKEIGIRKSLGATRKDILLQFLTESVIVCLLGGVLGIVAGFFLAKVVSNLAQIPPVIPFYAISLSFFFSVGMGIFFGFYPAAKASALNPVEALRNE